MPKPLERLRKLPVAVVDVLGTFVWSLAGLMAPARQYRRANVRAESSADLQHLVNDLAERFGVEPPKAEIVRQALRPVTFVDGGSQNSKRILFRHDFVLMGDADKTELFTARALADCKADILGTHRRGLGCGIATYAAGFGVIWFTLSPFALVALPAAAPIYLLTCRASRKALLRSKREIPHVLDRPDALRQLYPYLLKDVDRPLGPWQRVREVTSPYPLLVETAKMLDAVDREFEKRSLDVKEHDSKPRGLEAAIERFDPPVPPLSPDRTHEPPHETPSSGDGWSL